MLPRSESAPLETVDLLEQGAMQLPITGNPQEDEFSKGSDPFSSQQQQQQQLDDGNQDGARLQQPLLGATDPLSPRKSVSRRSKAARQSQPHPVKRRKRKGHSAHHHSADGLLQDGHHSRHSKHSKLNACLRFCCRNTGAVKSTIHCMNVMAKVVLWSSVFFLAIAVMWYSYELFSKGTDAHLIAWFSAGAFVLLGFPISIWGIVSHLAHYNQPHVQQYIVRILWMVPIYSIESWCAMRFHKQAIYIETLRDFYESYVLYSFLQFLIQVLGGEEALVLMLKDKSPTRGYHMWGMQLCLKPWLMGQPVRRQSTAAAASSSAGGSCGGLEKHETIPLTAAAAAAVPTPTGSKDTLLTTAAPTISTKPRRVVQWTSPFFVKCKFGVLQYVLLKLVSALAVLLLEWKGWYKEGSFAWTSGYLYVCMFTNLSQCWALYCLILFYYATHNELSPIRPVGKFLSVKALVFFTWWQSVVIAILYQMDMIPAYVVSEADWSPEDVAKGIQDYLICIEMFVAAVVHSFVFPHQEYSRQAVEARTRALNQMPMKWHKKRIGRNRQGYLLWRGDNADNASKSSAATGGALEMTSVDSASGSASAAARSVEASWEHLSAPPSPGRGTLEGSQLSTHDRASGEETRGNALSTVQDIDEEDDPSEEFGEDGEEEEGDYDEDDDDDGDYDEDDDDEEDEEAAHSNRPGFVRALIDSTIPRDLGHNTVGMITGEYSVERKTLLYHAATSDQYDLFTSRRHFSKKK